MATTVQEAIAYARIKVRDVNTEALTDADALKFASDFEAKARRLIVQKRKSLFITGGTMDVLTSASGIFDIPADVLLVKNVAIDLTGQGKKFPVTPVDGANLPYHSTLQYLRESQPMATPLIDFRGDKFEIFPTPTVNVLGGLEWQGHLLPEPYTLVTDEVEYPFTQDIYALGNGIAALYLEPLDAERSAALAKEAFGRVLEIIDMNGPGSQIPVKMTLTNPYLNGWNM